MKAGAGGRPISKATRMRLVETRSEMVNVPASVIQSSLCLAGSGDVWRGRLWQRNVEC